MKKIEIKRLLDNMVDCYLAYTGTCRQLHSDKIYVISPYAIHIDHGIQYLADSVDEALTLYPRDCEQYQYEHSFTYKGVRIFQIGNDEEFPEVVWNE